jgi:hypothetical protein
MTWADWLISRGMTVNLVGSTNNRRLTAQLPDAVVRLHISRATGGAFDV